MAAPLGLLCLMMATAGSLKLLHQLPGGIQIDQVVVAKLFALKLLRGGDAGAGAVPIERRPLVRVFPVAQVGGLASRPAAE